MGNHIYNTPHDSADALNGQEVTKIAQRKVLRSNGTGYDWLYMVRFDSGPTLEVWEEEIQEKPDA
jgi:hypothetical protein